jgi:hypothetical protein
MLPQMQTLDTQLIKPQLKLTIKILNNIGYRELERSKTEAKKKEDELIFQRVIKNFIFLFLVTVNM